MPESMLAIVIMAAFALLMVAGMDCPPVRVVLVMMGVVQVVPRWTRSGPLRVEYVEALWWPAVAVWCAWLGFIIAWGCMWN